MNKPRGDSKLEALTPEQKALLQKWLIDDNVTYSKAVQLCQKEFGLSVSLDALCRWRKALEREAMADRALKQALARASDSAMTAQAKVNALNELKDPFWSALMAQIGQDAFEKRMAQEAPPDIQTLKDLVEIASYGLKVKYDSEKLAQGREKLSQADRRIKLLEAKLSDATKIVQDTALSFEEKQARMKQVLGIA